MIKSQSEAFKRIRELFQKQMKKKGYTHQDAKKVMEDYKNGN